MVQPCTTADVARTLVSAAPALIRRLSMILKLLREQAPRRVGMRYGAQRRMKIGGCANWRPKDTRLPWRPQLEREDFRGSLGAARMMSACATFHPARGGGFRPWRQAGFLGCPTLPTEARFSKAACRQDWRRYIFVYSSAMVSVTASPFWNASSRISSPRPGVSGAVT